MCAYSSNPITSTCCGFAVQQVVQQNNPQQIEVMDFRLMTTCSTSWSVKGYCLSEAQKVTAGLSESHGSLLSGL